MYFCYVDESGDAGQFDPEQPDKTGSPYFILAGLIVGASKWKVALDTLKAFRKKIAREDFLPFDIEFHCAEMIDPRRIKAFTSISTENRWRLIDQFAETIGQHSPFRIVTVVIDKATSSLTSDQYLATSMTKLYQAYDEFLKQERENGIVFFDRANERHINTHARKLLGTGASGETIPGIRIGCIIEDPIFRVSADSIFIQSTDVIAYTLKEKMFPRGSRRKYNADKIFDRRIAGALYNSSIADKDGIIRI